MPEKITRAPVGAKDTPLWARPRRWLFSLTPVGHPDLAVLALVPLVLMVLNDSWTFLAPREEIDSYVYTGFFTDLRKTLNDFGPTYYGSRLPWLLLGNAVYSLTSVETANLTLRLILFYGAILSMYVIVRCLWRDRLAATSAAIALSVYPSFLSAIGWDYVDGAGVVATLLTMACLTAATRARMWQPLLVFGGLAAVTTVSINVFLISIMPAILTWYFLIRLRADRGPILPRIALFALGAGFAVGLYGLMNYQLTGSFHYLAPQINAVGAIDPSVYKTRGYHWIQQSVWLAFPAVGLVTSLALLALAARGYLGQGEMGGVSDAHFFAAVAALQMVLVSTIFLYFEFLTPTSPLQYVFYTSYLIPFSFIAIGAALALGLDGIAGWWKLAAGTFVFLSLVAPFAAMRLPFLPHCGPCLLTAQRLGLVALVMVLLLLSAWLRSGPLGLLAVLAISLLNIGTTDDRRLYFADKEALHERFLLVHDANAAVRPFNADGALRFWYDYSKPLGSVYRGVASMHLWGYRLVSEDFPKSTFPGSGRERPLLAGQTAAIFATEDDALVQANVRLGRTALRAEVLDRQTMRRGRDTFDIYIIRAVPQGRSVEREVRAGGFLAAKGGQVAAGPDGRAIIKTGPVRGAYAATLRMPNELINDFSDSQALVRIRARVDQGRVRFGLLKSDRSGWVGFTRVSQTTDGMIDLVLATPKLGDVSHVVVMTGESNTPSRVSVDGVFVSIYEADGSVAR